MIFYLVTESYLEPGEVLSTSNHIFWRAIWNKLPECIFESFEIGQSF